MKLFFIALLLLTGPVYGQHTDCLSQSLTIKGEVKKELHLDMVKLASFTTVKIPDLTITNHKGEVKRTLTGLQGVLLKDILQQAVIKMDSPKLLSEFYFVFTACDGYKVVYSWNEIFNSSTGSQIYLIKEKDGESISSITATDGMTGRRYVQGLSFITVKRAE
jgi:hypothetical protein